ncbi:DUF663-domain-containing protein [Violaceomyces palustris]|uniref:DUF663-domain-containing protein n=1 Tax=Violaceomyces palustris TaxID=1673888 RepID=A0ACD0P708_9BASI|nr:DUF663-domain-containing protein [Violaceomyces palustris]
MPHHHRAASLRQSNKPFKSKHSTKSSIKEAAKGELCSTADGSARSTSHKSSPLSTSGSAAGSRHDRRNQAKLAQLQKRAALIQSNRVFGAKSNSANASGAGLGKGLSSSSGGGAPRICAVVDLAEDGDSWRAVRSLQEEGEEGGIKPVLGKSVQDALANSSPTCELEALRFRQTLQFIPLPYGALYPILDACKCADFVLLVLSSSSSIDPGSWGELCLRTLQAQGLPTVLVAVPTLSPDGASGVGGSKKAGPALKAANETRKSLLSFARYFSPDVEKVHALDDHAERAALLRTLATSTPKRVAWRDFRAWTVSESAEWIPEQGEQGASASGGGNPLGLESSQRGTLKVEGWVRGAPLSANRLVHIPDFGDFEVEKITYAPPPTNRTRKTKSSATGNGKTAIDANPHQDDVKDVDMQVETSEGAGPDDQEKPLAPGDVIDARDPEYADDLVSENEPDEMDNEQTWPTEEEMANADAAFADSAANGDMPPPPAAFGTTPKSIKRDKDAEDKKRYQAAWIIESDEEDGDDDEDEDGQGDEEMDDQDEEEDAQSMMDDRQGSTAQASGSNAYPGLDSMSEAPFEDLSDGEEEAELAAYMERRKREKEEREDLQFPDEVDTPMDIPARQRFQRYRGLKSFRTSPWDPYEDLPRDYARIFQFDDFHRTRRRVEASAMVDGVQPGLRVCLWIKDVPKEAAVRARATGVAGLEERSKDNIVPFVIFGLLRHEHKKSVINFTCTRNTEYEGTVKSKDALILCLGPRRFRVNPIFSQHTRGGGKGSNNVHKFEKYLRPGTAASVGTVFAPITFGGSTAPALLLKERITDGEQGHDQRGVGARQMPHLVSMGTLLDAGPTRINAKRIILSGHPFKVHKKVATIRYMFFNPDDVRYFSPITLHTKHGRTGHIREPLGTHGYFKAHFDGPISQMDTIMLTLYKRVYPKWSEVYKDSQDEMPIGAV